MNRCKKSIKNASELTPSLKTIALAYLGEDDIASASWLSSTLKTHELYSVDPNTEIQGHIYDSKYYPQDNREYLIDMHNLNKMDKQVKFFELMQQVSDDYAVLLPRIINGIQAMRTKSYFDFASEIYVPIEQGFDVCIDWTKHVKYEVSSIIDTLLSRERDRLLGYIAPRVYPENDSRTKEEIERLNARIDGKKICNYLRRLRIELAKANGIEFFSEECPSVGPCAGTCAKCEQEAAYLRDKLAGISESERIIPDFKLTEWEG